MSKHIYGISYRNIDFVSFKFVKKGVQGTIYVFTHERNGKVRKQKVDEVGYIYKHPKTKRYAFFPNVTWCFSAENLSIISSFLNQLENKIIKFNAKKGELTGEVLYDSRRTK